MILVLFRTYILLLGTGLFLWPCFGTYWFRQVCVYVHLLFVLPFARLSKQAY